ncbi:MAG: hypothetical protein Q9173_005003 [Seirophora scorigena]
MEQLKAVEESERWKQAQQMDGLKAIKMSERRKQREAEKDAHGEDAVKTNGVLSRNKVEARNRRGPSIAVPEGGSEDPTDSHNLPPLGREDVNELHQAPLPTTKLFTSPTESTAEARNRRRPSTAVPEEADVNELRQALLYPTTKQFTSLTGLEIPSLPDQYSYANAPKPPRTTSQFDGREPPPTLIQLTK